jgi:DNA-binding MarR family transcriptional regulator
VERTPHPEDGRSFLLRLTPEGEALLSAARPAFRDLALAVETRLGTRRVAELRDALAELEASIDAELALEPVKR